jgi:hypothetical protein
MSSCRICFGKKKLINLGCSCKDDLSMVHYNCARDWFSKDLDIVLSGKLVDKIWEIKVSCKCEICKQYISKSICIKIYNELSKFKISY